MGEQRLGQGRDNAKNYFRDNPDVADRVEKQIREAMKKEAEERAQARAGRPVSQPVPEERPQGSDFYEASDPIADGISGL